MEFREAASRGGPSPTFFSLHLLLLLDLRFFFLPHLPLPLPLLPSESPSSVDLDLVQSRPVFRRYHRPFLGKLKLAAHPPVVAFLPDSPASSASLFTPRPSLQHLVASRISCANFASRGIWNDTVFSSPYFFSSSHLPNPSFPTLPYWRSSAWRTSTSTTRSTC
jgi:hypothetical protein